MEELLQQLMRNDAKRYAARTKVQDQAIDPEKISVLDSTGITRRAKWQCEACANLQAKLSE